MNTLTEQDTLNLFDYSVLVVDNDMSRSAESIVSKAQNTYPVELNYYVEPEKNISTARNMGVLHARGDLVALIDDDEFPDKYWLVTLFKALCDYQADGIFGSIRTVIDDGVPVWAMSADIFPDVRRLTGIPVRWKEAFLGNVLLKKRVFFDESGMFNRAFGLTGGEDVEFFRTKSERGYRLIGCDEAVVFASVLPQRCKRTYLVKRAFLEGAVYMKLFSGKERFRRVIVSNIALLFYSFIIPILFVRGGHRHTKYLIKICHHISMIFALFGVMLVKDRAALDSIEGQ